MGQWNYCKKQEASNNLISNKYKYQISYITRWYQRGRRPVQGFNSLMERATMKNDNSWKTINCSEPNTDRKWVFLCTDGIWINYSNSISWVLSPLPANRLIIVEMSMGHWIQRERGKLNKAQASRSAIGWWIIPVQSTGEGKRCRPASSEPFAGL